MSEKKTVLDGLRHDLDAAAETLAPPPVLRFRSMFGGVGVYADGPMFASLSDAGLALKLPPADRQELIEGWGAVPLQYRPDAPVSKSKVVIPDAVRADPERLAPWLARSIAFAAKDVPKARRKTKN
ncbi:MAG: TfoX/Sxy family protein [Chloroflexia bacterium]|nr:TfoX/Sxy family protein [Chloroflexia bacterium]